MKLRSYVLLCHAAIEEYLENISLSVLSESLRNFEADGRIRDPLLSACSYYKILLSEEAQTRNPDDKAHDLLLKIFKKAISEHSTSIYGVNGIKTKDQDSILLPIGVRLFDFDRLLSQSLHTFGGVRGKFAHGFGFRTVTPRAGLESNVRNIFSLIRPLDNTLCKRHEVSFA
ncbi:HEPN domain-containing protein [Pseudooceanicola nanhaiensis]|uniref:HEPN domain-containing protein n=1 Tax=Pseudooceanicola nanhaiensis TaxID=375761 RepID=UPI001CD56CB6|nr:hypothetical protein [Pseudooceanicola nanhaiensis]